VLGENQEGGLQGSDIQGLSADLLEAARPRNLSANSLAAYERNALDAPYTPFIASTEMPAAEPMLMIVPVPRLTKAGAGRR
jgi:hypothetical protein